MSSGTKYTASALYVWSWSYANAAGIASRQTIITLNRAIVYLFIRSFMSFTSFQVYLYICQGSPDAALHIAFRRYCIRFFHIKPPLSVFVIFRQFPARFHTFPAHDQRPTQANP
jgi:hypothetical protein